MITHDKNLGHVKMLVLDDQPDEIAGTLRTLGRKGVHIVTARDVQSAETLLKEGLFDVAMIDMRVPIVPDGELVEEGGKKLIEDMQSGNLGFSKRNMPFLIVTAQKRSIKDYEVDAKKTCLGVFGKLMHNRIISELDSVGAALAEH